MATFKVEKLDIIGVSGYIKTQDYYFFGCCSIILTINIFPSYVQSACKLFKAAEECRLDRDEERSYVLYMKYLTVYDIIKKRPDFKNQLVWLATVK